MRTHWVFAEVSRDGYFRPTRAFFPPHQLILAPRTPPPPPPPRVAHPYPFAFSCCSFALPALLSLICKISVALVTLAGASVARASVARCSCLSFTTADPQFLLLSRALRSPGSALDHQDEKPEVHLRFLPLSLPPLPLSCRSHFSPTGEGRARLW
jgi:hypothetical protein